MPAGGERTHVERQGGSPEAIDLTLDNDSGLEIIQQQRKRARTLVHSLINTVAASEVIDLLDSDDDSDGSRYGNNRLNNGGQAVANDMPAQSRAASESLALSDGVNGARAVNALRSAGRQLCYNGEAFQAQPQLRAQAQGAINAPDGGKAPTPTATGTARVADADADAGGAAGAARDGALGGRGDGDTSSDSDVEVLQEKGTVVTRDFPHMRPDCYIHKFKAPEAAAAPTASGNPANRQFCGQCYCYVCDVKAAECRFWGSGACGRDHANAHSRDRAWSRLRVELRQQPDADAKQQLLQAKFEGRPRAPQLLPQSLPRQQQPRQQQPRQQQPRQQQQLLRQLAVAAAAAAAGVGGASGSGSTGGAHLRPACPKYPFRPGARCQENGMSCSQCVCCACGSLARQCWNWGSGFDHTDHANRLPPPGWQPGSSLPPPAVPPQRQPLTPPLTHGSAHTAAEVVGGRAGAAMADADTVLQAPVAAFATQIDAWWHAVGTDPWFAAILADPLWPQLQRLATETSAPPLPPLEQELQQQLQWHSDRLAAPGVGQNSSLAAAAAATGPPPQQPPAAAPPPAAVASPTTLMAWADDEMQQFLSEMFDAAQNVSSGVRVLQRAVTSARALRSGGGAAGEAVDGDLLQSTNNLASPGGDEVAANAKAASTAALAAAVEGNGGDGGISAAAAAVGAAAVNGDWSSGGGSGGGNSAAAAAAGAPAGGSTPGVNAGNVDAVTGTAVGGGPTAKCGGGSSKAGRRRRDRSDDGGSDGTMPPSPSPPPARTPRLRVRLPRSVTRTTATAAGPPQPPATPASPLAEQQQQPQQQSGQVVPSPPQQLEQRPPAAATSRGKGGCRSDADGTVAAGGSPAEPRPSAASPQGEAEASGHQVPDTDADTAAGARGC